MAWIPERSVLFTGDLVFVGGTPFVPMGSVQRFASTRSIVAARVRRADHSCQGTAR